MATVTGLTAAKMLEMAGEEILTGQINGAGRLILTKRNGTTVDAGVATPPVGSQTWPVGSIYLSINSTNPGPQLGGTWIAWGSGRVPVGVDSNQSEFDTVEEVGGSKTITITIANLPPHSHSISHTHQPSDPADIFLVNTPGGTANRANGTGYHAKGASTTGGPSNSNSGDGSGSSTPMNSMPPYITCYMWKRVA